MISADSNIFIHAANRDATHHARARAFLNDHANNTDFIISELVLVEVYMGIRNPAIMAKPFTAKMAVAYCEALRRNSSWQVVDSAPEIHDDLWQLAAGDRFGFRRIIDARLGLSLRFHGVEQFATLNVKDFEGCGFRKVWNPL